MTFALQAEIKQIAHEIRQRFDQVETVAKQELHTRIEQLRALVAKLPGEVEGAEQVVVTDAKSVEDRIAEGVRKAVPEAEAFLASAKEKLATAEADVANAKAALAVKAAEVEALEQRLAAALKQPATLLPNALAQAYQAPLQTGIELGGSTEAQAPQPAAPTITQTTDPATPTT